MVSSYLVRYPALYTPAPDRVAAVLLDRLVDKRSRDHNGARNYLWSNSGSIWGFTVACLIGDSKRLQSITMPALIISQLVGIRDRATYAMARLWIRIQTRYDYFDRLFPVTASTLADSGPRPHPGTPLFKRFGRGGYGYSSMCDFRLPFPIPSRCSSTASVAPIGAVVGEWVGSSSGLGYLMLHANARGQTDLRSLLW